ncbi:hypothetical protein [Modestobacter marinus]|uniref:hypothetical protein n=1 Tax=Modestobacter marinus TaxID=477641 RepID=UPI001C953322|nr:hypothetical protein [Modestobacter marinus]
MTNTPDPGPTDVEGRVLPPYEGRRESADVADEQAMHRGGVTVGGATGPVESAQRKAPEPADTPRGAVASPAEEQPAEGASGGVPGPASVGPAHHPGTPRGEDAGEEDFEEYGGES